MSSNEDVRRRILVGAVSVFLFVLLTAVITGFPFQLMRLAGHAMEPGLKDQQRLIVDKLIYGVRPPRSGDVVMLYHPLDPDRLLAQRVIAREGDALKIMAGKVYNNDKPLSEDYVQSDFRSHDDWGPQVVPEGFVLGDRRNNSSDSRHWGFVPRKYIIGKIVARLVA